MLYKRIFIILILLFSGFFGFLLSFYHEKSNQQQDPLVLETFHSPETFVKQLQNDPEAGKKIFYEFCAACHAKRPQIDIVAPRIGDRKAWRGLRSLGKKHLLSITVHGLGAMPARGGCFECSDEQLQMAVDYIMDNSK